MTEHEQNTPKLKVSEMPAANAVRVSVTSSSTTSEAGSNEAASNEAVATPKFYRHEIDLDECSGCGKDESEGVRIRFVNEEDPDEQYCRKCWHELKPRDRKGIVSLDTIPVEPAMNVGDYDEEDDEEFSFYGESDGENAPVTAVPVTSTPVMTPFGPVV